MVLLCRHEAERLEQEAKGRLERQKIMDEAEAERARKELLELQANRCVYIPVMLHTVLQYLAVLEIIRNIC